MIVAAPSPQVRIATLVAAGWAELTLLHAGVLSTTALACGWMLLAVAGLAATRARSATEGRVRRVAAAVAMAVGLLAFLFNGVSAPGAVGGRLGLVVILAIAGNALVQDTVRDLYVGLALTCAALVFAAGVAGGAAVALPLIVGAGLVVACLGLLGTARLTEGRQLLAPVGQRPDPWLLASATAGALAVGALAFLLVPHPPGLHTQGKLGTAVRTAIGNPAGGSTAAVPRTTSGYLGRLDLHMRGRLPNSAVASVPADSPDLWRDQVFASYDGAAWYPTTPDVRDLTSGAAGTWTIPTEPGTVAGAATRTDDVRPAVAAPPLVLSPGQPASVRVDTRPTRTSEGSYFLPPSGGGGYAVTSYGYDALQLPAGVAVARSTGDVTDPVWTRLPVSVPGRVIQLGQSLAAGAHDRAEVVSRVESYLRTHEKYRLDAPVPPAGQDVVDAFLFDSHEGFCEHFAAAETVLLRSAGIPARLVAGYAYGQPQADGRRLFRASDAHAWVEVYAPAVGWTASDPTAGAVLSNDHPSLAHRLLDALRQALRSPGGRALVAGLLILVLLCVAGAVVLARRLLARRSAPVDAAPVDRLLGALARLERALALAGRPRRGGETLSELAQRLAEEDGSRGCLAAADGLLVLARATYSPSPPGPPDRSSAAAAIETYAETLEAEVENGDAASNNGVLRRRTGTRAGAAR